MDADFCTKIPPWKKEETGRVFSFAQNSGCEVNGSDVVNIFVKLKHNQVLSLKEKSLRSMQDAFKEITCEEVNGNHDETSVKEIEVDEELDERAE